MNAIVATLLFSLSAFSSEQTIIVNEPSFSAEKIEYNPVSKTFIIVKPKYFINENQAVPVTTYNDGYSPYGYENLCSFFGLQYEDIISTVRVRKSSISEQYQVANGYAALHINKDGSYSVKYDVGHEITGNAIDFMECKP